MDMLRTKSSSSSVSDAVMLAEQSSKRVETKQKNPSSLFHCCFTFTKQQWGRLGYSAIYQVCCENRSGPADRASSVRNRTVRGSYRIRNAYDPVWPDVNQPVLDKIDDRSSCTLFLLKKIAKQRYFCGTLRFVILINDDFPSFPSSLSSFPKTQTRPRQNLATPFSISRPASHPNGFFPSSFHTVVADLHR